RRATMKIRINSGIPMEPNMFPPRRILRPVGVENRKVARKASGHSLARERNAYDFGRRHVRMDRSGEEDLLTQPRSRLFIALALLAAATLVGGTIGGKLLPRAPAGWAHRRQTPGPPGARTPVPGRVRGLPDASLGRGARADGAGEVRLRLDSRHARPARSAHRLSGAGRLRRDEGEAGRVVL